MVRPGFEPGPPAQQTGAIPTELTGRRLKNLKQKYHKIRDGNKMPGNQRQEQEMFELMERVLGGRAPLCFQLHICITSLFIFADVNQNIIEKIEWRMIA